MKPLTHRPTALLAILATAGCSGAAGSSAEPAPQPAAEHAEFEALYRARMDSAMMLYTDADVHFMIGMIGHHGQALVMSALAPTNDAGASIRILTSRIINAQKDEIALMQQWLRDRGQTVPEIEISGTTMIVHGPQYAMHMPGMLTEEQLRELEAAQGSEFDRLFLIYMIQHHEGAVTMVDELFATDGAGIDEVVFKMASDIYADQTTEIARMESMLASFEN